MIDELILWRCWLHQFTRRLGPSEGERTGLVVIILLALLALAVTFFFAGTYVGRYPLAHEWINFSLGLVFGAGLLGSIRSVHAPASFVMLPIKPHSVVSNEILTGLGYPALIALIVTVPFYVGTGVGSYYVWTDYALLTLTTLALLGATYMIGVATARAVTFATRHSFVRFMAIIAVIILTLEFLIEPNVVTTALGATLNSISVSEAVLVLLLSLGVTGVSVALLEQIEPPFGIEKRPRYWGVLTRGRNFRATFSQRESALIQELLLFARNADLHQWLAGLLILFLITQFIISSALPQFPSFQVALHGAIIGALGYFIAFQTGLRQTKWGRRHFFLPNSGSAIINGRFLAALAISLIVQALVVQSSPLGAAFTLSIGAVIYAFMYWCGYYSSQTGTSRPLGWALLATMLGTIMLLVISSFIDIANQTQALTILTLWAGAYIALPHVLFARTRTKSQAALQ